MPLLAGGIGGGGGSGCPASTVPLTHLNRNHHLTGQPGGLHSTQVPCTAWQACGVPFGPCWPWLRFVTHPGSRGPLLGGLQSEPPGLRPCLRSQRTSPGVLLSAAAGLWAPVWGSLWGWLARLCVHVFVCTCLHLHTLLISLGTPQGQELFFLELFCFFRTCFPLGGAGKVYSRV